MWKDLPEQWKAVFCEAWDAMKSGSVPSGAVIYDREGNLLAESHNGFKNTNVNPYTSHSCINAINQLSLRNVESNSGLTIYSSMEPCFMCLGAIAISNIKEIHSASRDLFYGATHHLYDDAALIAKNISFHSESGDIEFFQIVLQSYFEVKRVSERNSPHALECYRRTNSSAVKLAEKLYLRRTLQQMSYQDHPCSEVYDMIMKLKDENQF